MAEALELVAQLREVVDLASIDEGGDCPPLFRTSWDLSCSLRYCERVRPPKVGCREPATPFHRYRRALLHREHYRITISGVTPWSMTKPTAKLSSEICIVAIATGVGDFTDRLACVQLGPRM